MSARDELDSELFVFETARSDRECLLAPSTLASALVSSGDWLKAAAPLPHAVLRGGARPQAFFEDTVLATPLVFPAARD